MDKNRYTYERAYRDFLAGKSLDYIAKKRGTTRHNARLALNKRGANIEAAPKGRRPIQPNSK